MASEHSSQGRGVRSATAPPRSPALRLFSAASFGGDGRGAFPSDNKTPGKFSSVSQRLPGKTLCAPAYSQPRNSGDIPISDEIRSCPQIIPSFRGKYFNILICGRAPIQHTREAGPIGICRRMRLILSRCLENCRIPKSGDTINCVPSISCCQFLA